MNKDELVPGMAEALLISWAGGLMAGILIRPIFTMEAIESPARYMGLPALAAIHITMISMLLAILYAPSAKTIVDDWQEKEGLEGDQQ